jgi:hypothetical protein
MKQHFQNDAERAAALKRSRYFVTAILIILFSTLAYTAYKTFIN